jgi:HK97 family phage portal protein
MVSERPAAARSEDWLRLSWLDTVASWIVPDPGPTRLRVSEFPSFDEQLAVIQRRAASKAWRAPSVGEAMGVPAIFGAVSLIANTVGSLSLEAFRQGSLMGDDERPRLIVRPNPKSTPRAFFRDTSYYLATRGEAWWWVAARDVDGAPMSLYPVPPWEITVAENDRDRMSPTITWGNRVIRNEDIRQITYLPSHDGLRGLGPLQLCGAAVSVTVEAQEWAANFYSGSLPSLIGTTDQDLSEGELKELDKQWLEKPPNLVRWMTSGMTLEEPPYDAQKAQLTESRQHQVGEAARMFSMPGALIEYQMGGSSLTYQNQADIWNDFQRRCLSPHYLEPIEQEISDLLTRSTVARFNLDQLLRADPKSRAEVYEKLVPIGVMSIEEARQREGYQPGSVDYAPVPLAPPQAVPTLLPINRTAMEVRCDKCHRMLAESATPPYRITCPRCKTVAANNEPVVDLMAMIRSVQQPQPHIEFHAAPVTYESPTITFERGAIQVDAAEPAKAPDVNVSVAAADLDGLTEAMQALADRPAPVVNVAPAEVTVESAQVTVEAPNVNITMPEPRQITRQIKRDKDNNIIRIEEVPA